MTESLVTAVVDLAAIAHNTREFARRVGPGVKIMPAVKADGYGHGAVQVARTALDYGAYALGVARTEEGIALRKAGIEAPILVFGYVCPKSTPDLMEFDLTATVSRRDVAQAISDIAVAAGRKVAVHLKVDTGMGRIGLVTPLGHPGCGVCYGTPLEDVLAMASMPGISIEGIYTHFALSDSLDKTYTLRQFEIFMAFIDLLKKNGLEIPLRHAANSAAAIEMPETHLDMIRPGISFYGLKPSDETDISSVDLRPAMEVKARIISLKSVPKGFKVSYGSTHVTDRDTVIAVVPIGYADGFSRHFSSNGHMLVRGERAPIVGRICMDLTMLDVGHIPGVSMEDEVVVFGRQKGAFLSVDELAERIRTINYEIVSNLNPRVKRVYLPA
jgi:alanine racemase